MRKYDTYKDSGIEWIGEIPSHWKEVRIKQLAIGNNTLFLDGDWIESKEIVFNEDNIRYITTGNIGEGEYKEQGSGYITEETFEKLNCTEVFPGDLIISRLNPPIGRACIIPNLGKRIVTSVDNVILRPNEEYSKNFLAHFFSNSKYFEFTLIEGRGATMQRISRGILGNIKIVVPNNIQEQTAIAAYLDRKTAEIDELIADKKRLLELYEEEKTVIINQAVTKGINPDVKMKDSGIEWLGEIPEHWEVKRLKYVAYLKSGNNIVSEQIKDNLEFPVFGGNGIRGYFNDFTHEGNHILIGRQGAYCGNIQYANGKFWASEHAVVLTQKFNYELIYFGELLRTMNLGQYSVSAAQPGLAVEVIKNLSIPFPQIHEQQNIVRHIETETARIDAKKSKTEKLIELLTEYRTALISEVVTGKIKVID